MASTPAPISPPVRPWRIRASAAPVGTVLGESAVMGYRWIGKRSTCRHADMLHRIPNPVTGSREDRAMSITSKRAWKLLGTRPTEVAAARGRTRELGYESLGNYSAALIAVDWSRAAPPAFAPLHHSDQTRRRHDLFLNQATTTVRDMAAQRHHGGRPAMGSS
jgi:hypothetical protein